MVLMKERRGHRRERRLMTMMLERELPAILQELCQQKCFAIAGLNTILTFSMHMYDILSFGRRMAGSVVLKVRLFID